MAVTDQYLINNAIYSLLENGDADAAGTTLTSMFSITEIVNAMNRVQNTFLLDTGMVITRTTIPGLVGVAKYSTPVDSIRSRRVTWDGSVLSQVDTWELDNSDPNWPGNAAVPEVWWENTLGQQQFAVALQPASPGTISLMYVALATTLTGLGVNLTVPDDWTPYIYWGTLAELFSSDGQAYDPTRYNYCRQRYQEGVELARLVMGGGGV